MSYYRAALSAAGTGNLSLAARLVKCSLVFEGNTAPAMHLYRLLGGRAAIEAAKLRKLRALAESKKYRKALNIDLPKTTRAHTIRGLLYMQLDRPVAARKEFALALALDTGNSLARKAFFTTFQDVKARNSR